jgi:hypothetical protein
MVIVFSLIAPFRYAIFVPYYLNDKYNYKIAGRLLFAVA